MRHSQARSWLRTRAGSRAASARTRASQWPDPAAARGAPVRIDFGEQNRRASERAAAKMGERTVAKNKSLLRCYLGYLDHLDLLSQCMEASVLNVWSR